MSDAVLQALTALNERLDRLESRLDAAGLGEGRAEALAWALGGLENVKAKAPVVTDAAATMANAALHGAADMGIDPVETGIWALGMAQKAASPEARAIAEKALDPANLALVERVLEHADLLEFALTMGAAMSDALEGRDIAAIAAKTGRLVAVLESPEMDALLDAVDGGVLKVANEGTTALVATRAEGFEPVGAIGAFFKLGDPDVKRAVGFGLAFAKRFGSRLQ